MNSKQNEDKTSHYKKIDLSNVDRKKVKQKHGIETNEKIKIYDEIKRQKELWTYPYPYTKNFNTTFENDEGALSLKDNGIRCHWDHHTFDNIGVYCPLNYRPKQVAKKGQNEIKTRAGTPPNATIINIFLIKENIPRNKDVSTLKNIISVTDAYYEVDGVFCSPECCLAFINNEKSKVGGSIYADSERLLHSMFGLTSRISPANNYRLLKEYGGNLTIEQFRSNNKVMKYEYHGTTVLVSHLFEKKLNVSTD